MEKIQKVTFRTPIEQALDVDGNGMTTAKKLYSFLELRPGNFARWCKVNIVDNEFATENEDYLRVFIEDETPTGGKIQREDFKLTAHFAKKLSVKGTGIKAEQAREYFTGIEERVKQRMIDVSQLSPELQMFKQIWDMQAKQELETKRIAAEQDKLKATVEDQGKAIQTVKDTFSMETAKDFRPWVNQCIAAIAESSNYRYIGTREERYQAVRKESYARLVQKKPCRLKQRVESEKGRAVTAGASAARVNAINKLTIIEGDKALKPLYETVLKEMMIAYCVDTKTNK